MKFLVKATAVLALASMLAPAVEAVQAQTFPSPADPGGSNLILTAWDPEAGISLVYALPGLVYQSLRDGDLAPQSWAIPSFGDTFGSDLANVRWHVTAIGGFAGANADFLRALFTTGPDSLVPVQNGSASTTFTFALSFHQALESECGGDPVCIADSSAGAYGGRTDIWGDFPALPFSPAGGVGQGGVDSALSFWDISQQDVRRPVGSDPAVVTPVAGGFAQWLLSSDGVLSYSVVPLPAAAWLLLSGLVGFGAISRRRRQAVA